MNSDYVGYNEANRRFGIAIPTIRRRVLRGDLTVYRDPLNDRKKLLKVSDLEELKRPVPMRPRATAPAA